MLSKEETNRYSRQIILPEIGTSGQEKLKNAKVLVVGAGGLGCPVLQYLVAAGVGTVGIIDGDVVDESNLHRQILYSPDDVGKPKAQTAAQKLSAMNKHCQLPTADCRLDSQNALSVLRKYDLVIDCSDNFPTRYLVNDSCIVLNKPLVFGSIYKFEGQVSVFNYEGGPTYRCLYPEPPQDSPGCSEIGVLGVLPGIIGTMMANEALKMILGTGTVLSGMLFVLDALNAGTSRIYFKKDPKNTVINSLGDYDDFCKPTAMKNNDSMIKEISAAELKKRMQKQEAMQIIDVREPSEFAEANLNGLNIPLKNLPLQVARIRKDIPVIVHCQKGGRSKRAIELLEKEFGFDNLYNLTGGIEAVGK